MKHDGGCDDDATLECMTSRRHSAAGPVHARLTRHSRCGSIILRDRSRIPASLDVHRPEVLQCRPPDPDRLDTSIIHRQKETTMRAYFLHGLMLLPLLFLASCASTPSATDDIVVPPHGTGYTIQPGDLLEVSVWKEKDLQRELLVRPDGGISFPLIGDVDVRGKTVSQLSDDIGKRLSRYIPDANVTVVVRQTAGHKFYVVGKVNRPGEFAAIRPINVMQALSMAGGLTPFAAGRSIVILRRVNDTEIAIPFRYGQVESGNRLEQNITLQSGDVVVVP